MGPPINSIDSVTRACWSRDIDPATWESLARQAASEGKLRSSGIEEEVTSSLLTLLSPATSTLPPPLIAYLRQSLLPPPPNTRTRSLVRPGYIIQQAAHTSTLPARAWSAVCSTVNAVLERSPELPAYTTKNTEELFSGISRICKLVRSQLDDASANAGPLVYLQRLVKRPPLLLSTKGVSESILKEYREETSALLTALSAIPDTRRYMRERTALRTELGRVVGLVDKAPQPRPSPTKDLSESISYADPDVSYLVSDLLYRSASPIGISSTALSVARLASLISYRLVEAPSRGSSAESALSSVFLELLLAATERLRSSEAKEEVVYQSFVYSRLPEVLRALFAKRGLAEDVPDGLQGGLATALRRFKAVTQSGLDQMAIDNASTLFDLNTLLISLAGQELISADVGASLADGIEPQDLHQQHTQDYYEQFVSEGDPEAIKELLNHMLVDFRSQPSIVSGLHGAIESRAQNSDLSALASICDILIDRPVFLEVVFLHVEPKTILTPLKDFLETFDTSASNFSDGSPIEKYGRLILFLELTLSRFDLHRDLPYHLGTNKGFIVKWLPSASAVYALSALDNDSKTVVHGWIGGLFGYGLSDDLVEATNPRLLLHVAPTICKQAIAACQAGVIDLEHLREGLSYFLQPLLSFTLPGVIHWLVGEIGRSLATPTRTTLYEVLQVFVATKDDPLPRAVLELVGADLIETLDKLPASPAPSLSRGTLVALVKRYDPEHGKSVSKPREKSWQAVLDSELSSGINLSYPISSTISCTLHSALKNSNASHLALRIMNTALSSATPNPVADEDEARKRGRLRRAVGMLLASPSSTGVSPLLTALNKQHLRKLLSDAIASPDKSTVELLGEVLATGHALLLGRREGVSDAGAMDTDTPEQTGAVPSLRDVKVVVAGLRRAGDREVQKLNYFIETFANLKLPL